MYQVIETCLVERRCHGHDSVKIVLDIALRFLERPVAPQANIRKNTSTPPDFHRIRQ